MFEQTVRFHRNPLAFLRAAQSELWDPAASVAIGFLLVGIAL